MAASNATHDTNTTSAAAAAAAAHKTEAQNIRHIEIQNIVQTNYAAVRRRKKIRGKKREKRRPIHDKWKSWATILHSRGLDNPNNN